jgi:hypothetical protein
VVGFARLGACGRAELVTLLGRVAGFARLGAWGVRVCREPCAEPVGRGAWGVVVFS